MFFTPEETARIADWSQEDEQIETFFAELLAKMERGFQQDVLRILQGLPAAKHDPTIADASVPPTDA